MDHASPRRLFLVYVAAVLVVAAVIVAGSLAFWQMSGRADADATASPPASTEGQ